MLGVDSDILTVVTEIVAENNEADIFS